MKNHLILTFLILLSTNLISQTTYKNIKFGSNSNAGKFAQIDDMKIYYETYGKGTPLILIHGGLGSISNFDKCIPALASKFRIIAADTPGHGRSSLLETLNYDDLAKKMSLFLDYLQIDSCYVMGWSEGAIIGLHLAADRPDKVKKLIAVAGNTRLDALKEESIKWMKNDMIAFFKNNKNWLDYYMKLIPEPDKLDEYLLNTQKLWLSKVSVPDSKVKSISIPTMIVQGDRDEIKLEHAIEIKNNIKNSQLSILPNTTHSVFHEKPKMMIMLAEYFF